MTTPPRLSDVLALYAKCGLRSHNAIYSVAHVCRASNRPGSALALVRDSIHYQVDVTEKLLSMFAACCAEGHSPDAADTAEHLLRLIRHGRIAPHRNRQTFGNLVKALVSQNRVDAACNVIPLMDAILLPPSEQIFTHILSALSNADRVTQGMAVFRTMVQRNVIVVAPVLVSFVAACGRCSDRPAIEILQQYARQHALLDNDIVVCAFVSAYDRCGHLDEAERVFGERAKEAVPSPSTFNTMIAAYSRHGVHVKAVEFCERVLQSPGVLMLSPEICFNIVSAFAKADCITQAMALLDAMRRRGIDLDIPALCCLVAGCGRCSHVDFLYSLHERWCLVAPSDDYLTSAFITAFAQSGHLRTAKRVFSDRRQTSTPNVVTFTSMIAAYANVGMLTDAMVTFEQLKTANLRPDEVTLGALLSACRHAADLDLAIGIVSELCSTWHITMNDLHLACLIGLHARLGDLDKCEQLATTTLSCISWMELLDACRKHGDVERACRVFRKLCSLSDLQSKDMMAARRILCDLYDSVGCADEIRATLKLSRWSNGGST
ncbi:Pentacotripeptide-repeat region of PRORP domain-containing protein [Plasmodiophora brassicae]